MVAPRGLFLSKEQTMSPFICRKWFVALCGSDWEPSQGPVEDDTNLSENRCIFFSRSFVLILRALIGDPRKGSGSGQSPWQKEHKAENWVWRRTGLGRWAHEPQVMETLNRVSYWIWNVQSLPFFLHIGSREHVGWRPVIYTAFKLPKLCLSFPGLSLYLCWLRGK